MKRIFLLIVILPIFAFAQKTKLKPKTKTKAIVKPVAAAPDTALNGGFIIDGELKGFADGTTVALLNGQTGVPEAETTISKEKFILKGKLSSPDFKILQFNKLQLYVTIFLDNSKVKLTATKETLDKVIVTGSPAHQDFLAFNNLIQPYQSAFNETIPYDSAVNAKATELTYQFAATHAQAFINPLAIYRYYQLTEDVAKADGLYNQLTTEIKNTPMGNAVAQVIAQAKQTALGYVLPDFSQTDTAGISISLASFRGKYVLVDFWASWCGPCRRENPNVVAAYNKFKDKNFTVLGVSIDKTERKNDWLQAIKDDNLNWTQLLDWNNTVAQQFQISSIPQNFLLDPEGKVLAKNLRGPALERKLLKVLK